MAKAKMVKITAISGGIWTITEKEYLADKKKWDSKGKMTAVAEEKK